MTKSTNAWGWLAAGVLALGVNGFLHDEGAGLLRQVADRVVERSGAVLALATGRADEFLARVQTAGAREQVSSCLGSAMARIRTQMADRQRVIWLQAMQEDAQQAQLEVQANRIEAQMEQFQLSADDFNLPNVNVPNVRVICPRVRVNVPSPVVKIPSPVVHVKPLGSGSI